MSIKGQLGCYEGDVAYFSLCLRGEWVSATLPAEVFRRLGLAPHDYFRVVVTDKGEGNLKEIEIEPVRPNTDGSWELQQRLNTEQWFKHLNDGDWKDDV